MIQVNVNGFLTQSFQQARGLRQGNPLSPVLFNIAFDPLLRSINNFTDIRGFDLQQETNNMNMTTTTPVTSNANLVVNKVIAYADDILVTLSNQDDFHHLQHILNKYMQASNAKLNFEKTQVLSLSGSPHPHWQEFLQDQGITHWHDKNASNPLIYLGYAICSSPSQRAAHAQQTIAQLKQQCLLYAGRSLT